MSTPTILLTGAAGLIGSQMLRLLAERDAPVVAYDKAPRPAGAPASVKWISGDVCDGNALRAAITSSKVRRIIHAASILQADCQRNPYLGITVNVGGTLAVFQAAAETSVERVVFTSSIAVYGGTLTDPMPETHPCAPKSLYGTAKLLGEQVGAQYAAQKSFDFTALRYGLVYGPGRVGSSGIASRFQNFVRAAIEEGVIRLPRTNPRKPFLFASDAAASTVHACLKTTAAGGVFNIGGPGYTMDEVGQVLKRMCPAAKIVHEDQPTQPGEVDGSLDTTRAREDLGFRPLVSMEEGLERVGNYLREVPAP